MMSSGSGAFKRGDLVTIHVSKACPSAWVHGAHTSGEGTVTGVWAASELPDLPGHLYQVSGYDDDGLRWQSTYTAGELQRAEGE